jgi:hypothetical protein
VISYKITYNLDDCLVDGRPITRDELSTAMDDFQLNLMADVGGSLIIATNDVFVLIYTPGKISGDSFIGRLDGFMYGRFRILPPGALSRSILQEVHTT